MIKCQFEDRGWGELRHVVTTAIIFNKNKDKILLVKRSSTMTTCPNKWAFVGGFLGQGETISQAINREVQEEAGTKGNIIDLFRIVDSPHRPSEKNRNNVDFIWLFEARNTDVSKHDHEVAEVKWFDLDKPPPKETWAFDHYETYELVIKYLKQKFPLPLITC